MVKQYGTKVPTRRREHHPEDLPTDGGPREQRALHVEDEKEP